MHKADIYRYWFPQSNATTADVLLRDLDLDARTFVRVLCQPANLKRDYLEHGDRTNKTIAIKYKVVYLLSIAIFTFELEPLWRSKSNYLAIWIANLSKTVIASAKMHKDERIYRILCFPSNALIADVLRRDLNLDSLTIVRIVFILAKFEREYLANGDIFRLIHITYVDCHI